MSLLFLFTFDNQPQREVQASEASSAAEKEVGFKKIGESLANPVLWILLAGAILRQTAGLTWAYNTQLYFQNYHPQFDLGLQNIS